jgi:hypothetical protein
MFIIEGGKVIQEHGPDPQSTSRYLRIVFSDGPYEVSDEKTMLKYLESTKK